MPLSQRRGSAVRCLSLAALLTAGLAAAARADEPVVWTNVVGASTSGNSITKTTTADAWDAGGASVNVLRDGSGYVEFTADTNGYRMAGLGHGDTNQDYTDVDYGILVGANQDLYVFESGNYRGYFGSYAAGDRFRVEVRYGVVRYRKNGVVFYTSTVAPQYPLRVDTSLRSQGGTISDARVGSLVWTNEAGVAVAGSSLTKTAGTGWTAGAISTTAIEAADGAMEFTAIEANTTRAAGLSNGDTNQDVADIDFAVELHDDATIEVLEGGTSRGTFGSYSGGDRFRVELRAGVVTYARNGVVFYTSSATPSYPLRVDTALYTTGATLADVTLESVVWTNVTGVTAATATLVKTAADGWNAGASTTQALAGGDGFVEWTALETDTRRTAGLKTGTEAAQSYADIDYAIDLSASGALEVFELGTSRGQVGTYAHGDRLRVQIEGGVVRYLKNGAVLYSSTVEPTYPVRAAAALYTAGATVADLSIGDLVLRNATGVQVFASGMAKTASTGWNAGASSSRRINSGYVEFTASETNSDRMFGLSHVDANVSYATVEFGIYLEGDGALMVSESGVYKTTLGSYAPGARLRVAVEGQTVRYYWNGVLSYTSSVTPVLPLIADTSL